MLHCMWGNEFDLKCRHESKKKENLNEPKRLIVSGCKRSCIQIHEQKNKNPAAIRSLSFFPFFFIKKEPNQLEERYMKINNDVADVGMLGGCKIMKIRLASDQR